MQGLSLHVSSLICHSSMHVASGAQGGEQSEPACLYCMLITITQAASYLYMYTLAIGGFCLIWTSPLFR